MRFDAFRTISFGDGSSTTSPGTGGTWTGGTLTTRQADELVSFWGVCTHFKYPAYNGRKAAICALIADAGMKWVRDGWGTGTGDEVSASSTLISYGLKLHATHSPGDTGGVETKAAIQGLANAHASRLGSSLLGVEGWNEPGGFAGYSGDASLRARVANWQQWLWEVYRSTTPYQSIAIAGPSLADSNTASKWSSLNLTAYANRSNLHDYPGNSYAMVDSDFDRFVTNGNLMVNTNRRITTETGQSNGTADAGYNVPNASACGITVPRVQLEHFRRGWELSATYEFLDEGTDNTFENAFGLVTNSLTPKPAYTTTKNILNLLSDPGTAFVTSPLPVTMTGNDSITRYVALQKRTGVWWLIIWQQAQVWNSNGTRSPSVSVPVTLTFDRSRTVTVYDPHVNQTAVSSTTGSTAQFNSTEKTTLVRIV